MNRDIKRKELFLGRKNESIGGGYFVFRRGKKTGRVGITSTIPFEHPSYEAAKAEADRLMSKNPGEKYVVFGAV